MSPAKPPTGLRERKKRQTRETVLTVANEMFEARGYENVTVAEIADAASISVKTLFTYFRSKEDLAFGGEHVLRDELVAAVRERPEGTTPVAAVAGLLDRLVAAEGGGGALAGYQHGFGSSDALRSRRRRMWEGYEDALTAVLTQEADGAMAGPRARLAAAMLVAMVRSLTSPEVLEEVERHSSQSAQRGALRAWVAAAAPLVACLDGAR
ncbi:MAG TPA: helix-turn-helix domain-containing protein [Streptosporangiaceae bacterium]|jgi:AcrR family transcriptional regulator|nr:helix-turn-helix domain-containing protein [Streptosporangiaceae bacterium]